MKDLVLVGAGHTHVQLIRRAAMAPLDATVTLVVDRPTAVYSGMVPGLVAGQYAAHELSIDARPLARRAGVRVLHSRATRIDPATRHVHLEGRPPIRYDVLSLNIGSTVAGRDVPGVREHAVATRPIHRLLTELDDRIAALGDRPSIAVVGAGAGGVELAFCLQIRLAASGRTPEIHLLYRSDRPLPGRDDRTRARIEQLARERGLHLHPNAEVQQVHADAVQTPSGPVPADLTVWVTGATGLPLATDSDLPVDRRGFVWVDDQLRVEGLKDVFAAGDCAVLRSWPEVPKAGVYAVRQGPTLDHNVRAALSGSSLEAYRAQRDFFGILNLGDGTALGSKWSLSNHSAMMFAYKDRIDRAFMERFQVLDADGAVTAGFDRPMAGMDGEMVCGGCAAKVAQQPLARALARLPPVEAPEIDVGPAEADDVVSWRHENQVTVQNLDAFSAFTDDPWLVGRVAAHNATSDVWAKGVRPRFAMATVQIPTDSDHEETLYQVMAGLRRSLDDDQIALLGGHTTLGEKLVVGLCVTGYADELPWRNAGAQPGDGLVLTRPLGTGVLFHADMAGRAPGTAIHEVLLTMQRGNRAASELCADQPIHAATDVTGFGLAGHLAEMLRASGCSATLQLADVPLYPGVSALLAQGERSTFHDNNRELLKSIAVRNVTSADVEALFDPQTAGGLLFATPNPTALAAHLHANGETAWIIGTCTESHPSGALFEVVP